MSDVAQASAKGQFRAERAMASTGETAWVVIDSDWNLHVEACAYLASLRAADRSSNTERVYAGRVALFLNYCALSGMDWHDPEFAELHTFLRWLVTEPLQRPGGTGPARLRSKATANAIVTTTSEFLKFGAKLGWVAARVPNLLSQPKYLRYVPPGFDIGERDQFRTTRERTLKFRTDTTEPALLTEDETAAVVSAAANARDRFLVTALLETGMRIGEALGLRRSDLHFLARSEALGCGIPGPHLHVVRRTNENGALAKSRYPRTIPVTQQMVDSYSDYQFERDIFDRGPDNDAVFVNLFREPRGRSMSYANTKEMVDRLAGGCGFAVRPHMLRHTAATRWIEAGVDPDIVQALLGHVSFSSTERYIHASKERMREAVEHTAKTRRETPQVNRSAITESAIHHSRRTRPALAVDNEAWQHWLEERIDPNWRPGEWDPGTWFFDGDQGRDGNMITRCPVQRCGAKLEGDALCTACRKAWRTSGLALDVFTTSYLAARAKVRPGAQAEGCLVRNGTASCARPAVCQGLCRSHYGQLHYRQNRNNSLSLQAWLAAGQDPYPANEGSCAVPRCEQFPYPRDGLCRYHHGLYRREGIGTPALEWAATAHPHLTAGQFSMVPLRPLVRVEMLYALQRRDASGDRILPKMLRSLISDVRDLDHLFGLAPDQFSPIHGISKELDSHRGDIVHWLQAGYEEMTGADPTKRLVWDFRTLDLRGSARTNHRRTHSGRADFTVISQTWLRDLAMEKCRTFTTSTKVVELLTAVEVASRALEATADGGHHVGKLGPEHLDAITQAFRGWAHPDGQPRSTTRRYVSLEAVFSLVDFGRRSRMMKGVTDAFLRDPRAHRLQLEPKFRDEVGKAIPEAVITHLDQNLAQLECNAKYPDMTEDHQRLMIRTLYIVLRDTGRRPNEVCSLRNDCIDFDHDGPVLIWDNTKAGRKRRRLPIPSSTAESIAAWRAVRDTLFTGDSRDNYLFPSGTPDRIDPHFRTASLGRSLRIWVDRMTNLLSDAVDAHGDRINFDPLKIYPYAFRHSYAQRHADAGVQIDVLCELMDHRSISTTQGYYRVNLKRKRQAIRTLSKHVTDRHGIATPTASSTTYEMRSVAAPFGNCVEPSNVKAGGGSCPIRFQCSGCGFYRPDPSYQPVIEDHIRSLKADRETAAAMDIDPYVLRNPDDQIESYRHVLGAMKERLDALPEEERYEVEQASTLLRRLRAGNSGRTSLPLTVKTRARTS